VPEKRWPNLFLVGTPKAGTTSLWHYLGAHPEIHLGGLKEPHFFTSHKWHYVETVNDETAYLRLFAGGGGARYICDASGSYLNDVDAPAAIRRVSPEAKIVISLREPVARAFSSYLHSITFGERRSFEDALRGERWRQSKEWSHHVRLGFYVDAITRYQAIFGAESVYVVFFEELAVDPLSEMNRLFGWLGLEPLEADSMYFERHNAFALPRNRLAAYVLSSARLRSASRHFLPRALRAWIDHRLARPGQRPQMQPETRELLEQLYAPERPRIEALLGRPVPW
jgi:hypothetical protein